MVVTATAPGRINLIGEHTDTTGGWCLPMAIDLATTVTGTVGGDRVVLRSDQEAAVADVPIAGVEPATVEPAWGRYVAGVVAAIQPAAGFTGTVTSPVPPGAGLSSSAALEVAVALALGFDGTPLELARACQRAEQVASGVPCGIMDQLASAAGVDGHALLIDTRSLDVTAVPLPEGIEVVAVHSGERRRLEDSAYGERHAALAAAEQVIGPLRDADVPALRGLADPEARRRARHVITENARVHAFVAALRSDDRRTLGDLLAEGHASLRHDLEVSTPALDALVQRLTATPGVLGARLTGAGFGGCAVALCEPGALAAGPGVWRLRAASGARRHPG